MPKTTKQKTKKKIKSVEAPDGDYATPLYQVVLNVNEKELISGGQTLMEAFDKLENLEIFNTQGTLKVKKGDKEAETFLIIPRLRAFFADRTFRQIVNDNIETMLK
jgi:hypothetical protein